METLEKKEPRCTLYLSLPIATYDKIAVLAAKDDRSFAAIAKRAIEQYIARRGL